MKLLTQKYIDQSLVTEPLKFFLSNNNLIGVPIETLIGTASGWLDLARQLTFNESAVFDEQGRCVESPGMAEGSVIKSVYNEQGKLSQYTDFDGEVTKFDYDAQGNCTMTTFESGDFMEETYDSENRKTSMDFLGVGYMIVYSDDGLTSTKYTTDGDSEKTVTSKCGGVTETFKNNSPDFSVRTEKDDSGRAIGVTYASGNFALRTFDDNGNITSRTGKDQNSVLAYDEHGNCISDRLFDNENSVAVQTVLNDFTFNGDDVLVEIKTNGETVFKLNLL